MPCKRTESHTETPSRAMNRRMPTRRPVNDHLAILHQALIGEAVDNSPLLVFVADEDMCYVAVSRRACDALGYTRDELLRLRVTDVASESTAPAEYAELVEAGFRSGRATLRTKDGVSLEFTYVASEATIAGLPFYISFGALAADA
jgi:PAS domain S-box-containing protein